MKPPPDSTGLNGPPPSDLPRSIELAADLAAKKFGADAGAEIIAQHYARAETRAKLAESQSIPSGCGRAEDEEEAGRLEACPVPSRETRQQRRYRERRAKREAEKEARARAPRDANPKERPGEARRSRRVVGTLQGSLRKRLARDNADQVAQAEALALEALKEHGITHHYRPLVKLAFFCGYMAASDPRGLLGLQILREINVPAERAERVLEAMYNPNPYTPRRDIRRGKREDEKMFEGRRIPFGQARRCHASTWVDGERAEHHPAAVRVLACFIFLWLSKSPTRRKGYTGAVRGMGRGVFESITRSGKSALFGHEDGMPGAMLALKLAGVIQYNQTPKNHVRDARDRGPSGHAYNVYWFAKTKPEADLDRYHEAVARLAALPTLARLVSEPELLELERAARPPPDVPAIDPADIPF